MIQSSGGFAEYRRRVFQYYQSKKYGDALAAAQEASQRFPEYDAKTSFWIACILSRLGEHDRAIQTLQSATKRAIWWPADSLQDSDLESIRNRPEFRTIEEDCKRLQQLAPKTANPQLMVRVPTGHSERRESPALIVFHGRGTEHPGISAEDWLPVLSTGTILAAPWSSQVYDLTSRCWDNWELAEQDVKWTFQELRAKHRLDSKRIVLGGFSQGAALSIYSALKGLIPSCGFVAVAPSDWVRPEARRATERSELSEPFAGLVRASNCRGLRGTIIIGDMDPFLSKIEQLYALMVDRGLDGKLQVEKGIGHEYPKGFDNKLREAVEFVSGSDS
jgi:predicted esterase